MSTESRLATTGNLERPACRADGRDKADGARRTACSVATTSSRRTIYASGTRVIGAMKGSRTGVVPFPRNRSGRGQDPDTREPCHRHHNSHSLVVAPKRNRPERSLASSVCHSLRPWACASGTKSAYRCATFPRSQTEFLVKAARLRSRRALMILHLRRCKLLVLTLTILGSVACTPTAPSHNTNPAFVEQESHSGDCGNRPSGTVCIGYDDGYRWLVSDAIRGWRQGSWEGQAVQVAIGFRAEYHHVLGTKLVMQVNL